MSDLLFVDTSAWFAFVNRSDPDHRATKRLFEGAQGRLVTSNFVFDETVTLCALRLGHDAAVQVGEALSDPDVVELVRASLPDERDAWKLLRARAEGNYSYTDCVSFAMMRRLGITRAAALDEGFRAEGFEVLP